MPGERNGQDQEIVTFTRAAHEKVTEILDDQQLRGRAAVRIAIQGRAQGRFEYQMGLEDTGPEPGDVVQDLGEFKVYMDRDAVPKLRGARVDFDAQLMGGGFQIDNPNPVWDDPLKGGIQQLIDSQINPGVASHGGHVELLDVKDDKVYVRLAGGCQGCGMVDVTLRQGIERLVKQAFPQIQGVVDTTDHAGGTNPYFQPAKGSQAGASPFHQPSKGAPQAGPYYQPSKGGGCGAPGCGAGGCGHQH